MMVQVALFFHTLMPGMEPIATCDPLLSTGSTDSYLEAKLRLAFASRQLRQVWQDIHAAAAI